jgi:hypothetical protein
MMLTSSRLHKVIINLNKKMGPNFGVAIMVVENKWVWQIVIVTPNKMLTFVMGIKGNEVSLVLA